MSIYLDYNATARVRPESAAAVAAALELGGNPSSVHAAGRKARALVEDARAQVARLVGAADDEITPEHEGVVENARACAAPGETWPVDRSGVADLDWLEDRLASGPPALVCLMAANNETGVVQPVAEAAALVRRLGGWLHVDAVQAAGKIALDVAALGADSLALSAHKLGGPQGAGALVAGPRLSVVRQIHGGGLERGRRSGTENVPGLAGFGAAAEAARLGLDELAAQADLRDGLARAAVAEGAEVVGEDAPRLPQTLCFAMPGFESALQVMALDLAGVMVSAGAACSSGRVKPSRVVEAMSRPDLAPYAIRVSGGWATTPEDWTSCAAAWRGIVERRRARAPAAA